MRDKIFDRDTLARLLGELRRHKPGLRMVFTNGCFDLLHVGHLRYLCQARGEGDLLIVAINSDDSVRRLKGAGRPILSLEERLQILAGLACVDYVTWFDEDTPIALLEMLRPELLVKGGTYPVEGVVGHDLVGRWGGAVKTLILTEGCSTTGLIEKVLAMRARA